MDSPVLAKKRQCQGRRLLPARYQVRSSEDPATYLNLATALYNSGRLKQAESILEQGIAAYPYIGQLVARLAIDYARDGQPLRAQTLIAQYRKIFPEDTSVRGALKQIEGSEENRELPASCRVLSDPLPR
jgi:tetratricopeptide (TPR) repeat protein